MILVVDDDIAVQTSLSLIFKESGQACLCASNPVEAERIISSQKPDVIVLDMNFGAETSGIDGLEFLKQIKVKTPEIPVILLTAWASISLAVEGMKAGAADFVSKPWDNDNLLKSVQTAVKLNNNQTNTTNRKELDKKYEFSNIIGESPQLVSILETIARVSKTDAPVLILGESGTGKELIAEAIHQNSLRKNEPFVKVNLGGISSSLFESEMFGHKKGAFTDAYSDRKGWFELANNGSIFLDEIGDLDFNSQVKLLRVLQDKTYQILGDCSNRKTNVRVICATNRNLQEMVKKGSFREDLYYRINLISIQLPPLRERKEDLNPLSSYFLKQLDVNYNAGEITIENSAMKWLETLHFPGNIREFKNTIERAWLLTGKNKLSKNDFEKSLENIKDSNNIIQEPGSMTINELERQMIMKAMEKYGNNLSKVAKTLGLSRGTLYRRLEEYNISFTN